MTSPDSENNLLDIDYNFHCIIPNNVSITDVTNILPDWKTEIVDVQLKSSNEEPKTLLEIKFYIKASTIEEFNVWRSEFEELNKLTYSIRSSGKGTGRYINYKQRLQCQHNTISDKINDGPKSKTKIRTKNTNCPSKMLVTIYPIKKRKEGDLKMRNPCEVMLISTHNHDIATTLRYRKVSDETRDKLLYLFKCGHTASTAMKMLRMDIEFNYENPDAILADRKFYPDYEYCKHLHSKEVKCKDGPVKFDKESQEFLKLRIKDYNEEAGSNCIQMEGDDQENYVICICTPLMKRVHKHIKESSDIVLIDSWGSVDRDRDREGSKVSILLTHTHCGALPLGVIITSKTELISNGFAMLKDLVGKDLFYGNTKGPKIFLTDNSQVEQEAVNFAFPGSKHLLCICFVLQAIRGWLNKSSSRIPPDLQTKFFGQFRSIMFAESSDEAFRMFREAKSCAVGHDKYIECLQNYWDSRELWALAYCNRHLCDEYSETSMRLLKEKILEKVKTFNTIQLVDFILTKFTHCAERRLLDVAYNRKTRNNIFGRKKPSSPEILEKVNVLNEQMVLVPSEAHSGASDALKYYIVDMAALTCTCSDGTNEKFCKHIDWACLKIYSKKYNKAMDTKRFRRLYYVTATGLEPPDDWLSSLPNKRNNTNGETGADSGDDEYKDVGNLIISEVKTFEDEVFEEQDVQAKGTELFEKIINEINTRFIQESPAEAIEALEILYKNITNLQTTADFVSACASFGREYKDSPSGLQGSEMRKPTSKSRRKPSSAKSTTSCKKIKLMNNLNAKYY